MALKSLLRPCLFIQRTQRFYQCRSLARLCYQDGNQDESKKIYICATQHRHNPQLRLKLSGVGVPVRQQRWMTSASELNCWKCNHGIYTRDLFCSKCGTIQRPVTSWNYFEILGVDVNFDQDEGLLTKNFRDLQKKLHPDKFSQKSSMEREFSEEHSSLVNKSYQTLLKPLSRGLYLLELHGQKIEEGQIDMDPTFLMEIMEINEQLETTDINTISRIQATNLKDLEHYMSELSEAFKCMDIHKAKKALTYLKYYANIDEKAKELKFSLTGSG